MVESVSNNARRYGQAPYRIAVIHGGPGAAGEMALVATALAGRAGALEPLQTADSVDGQIAALAACLRAWAAPPVTCLGHSWGAWLAVLTAARQPELIGKLVLVGCAPLEAR